MGDAASRAERGDAGNIDDEYEIVELVEVGVGVVGSGGDFVVAVVVAVGG